MPLSDGPQNKMRRGMRGKKEVSDPHRTRIAAKNRLPVRLPKKTKGGKRNSSTHVQEEEKVNTTNQ